MRNFILLVLVLATVSLTSCDKCDASNSVSGIIVEDAIVRVTTMNVHETNFITDGNQVSYKIQMSLDGGYTYKSVDWNKYGVMSVTTTASCSTGYHRDVTVDQANKIVTYTVTLSECPTCDGTATIPNFVLISKVPSNYTPKFIIN